MTSEHLIFLQLKLNQDLSTTNHDEVIKYSYNGKVGEVGSSSASHDGDVVVGKILSSRKNIDTQVFVSGSLCFYGGNA